MATATSAAWWWAEVYLAIDASTMTGSAALFDGEYLVDERTVAMKGVNEERLMPAIVDLVTAHAGWGGLEAVVVGEGPGSFTSLRIAAAIAKGITTSLGVSLNVVPSLGLLVAQDSRMEAGRYLATLDAMRGECFAAIVEVEQGGRIASVGEVARVPASELPVYAAQRQAHVHGYGASNASGHAGVTAAVPHARGAARLVAAGLARVVDLASWEPDYGRLAEAQVKWEAEHGRPLLASEGQQPSPHPTTPPHHDRPHDVRHADHPQGDA